ncbi:hypothetical protein [Thomasclavelia cocleata]|nr:hypothetical protein [Thomasclavelia cocleata]
MSHKIGVKIEAKNLDEYIEMLQQLQDIIEKLNNTNIEIEVIQLSHKD